MQTVTEIPFTCPAHDTELDHSGDSLKCSHGCVFKIEGGIPRFVPLDNYSAAFGEQWKRYRQTQLDSYTGEPLSESRLRRCLGEDLWSTLEGKQVLEAGCGAGRFTEVLLTQGANVTSIDMSDAVTANQESFPQDESHRIAQADITKLPFPRERFDIVICLGVIQHTPDPERTIAALYESVRPGGWLVIDHYRFRWRFVLRTAPVFRMFMRKMERGTTIAMTEKMVDLLLPLHKAVRTFRPAQTMLSRLSPLVVYYHGFPQFSDEMQREWALLDTHDSLTDYYKHFRNRGQITRTLQDLGARRVWAEYGGNGVEARAQRPFSSDEV